MRLRGAGAEGNIVGSATLLFSFFREITNNSENLSQSLPKFCLLTGKFSSVFISRYTQKKSAKRTKPFPPDKIWIRVSNFELPTKESESVTKVANLPVCPDSAAGNWLCERPEQRKSRKLNINNGRFRHKQKCVCSVKLVNLLVYLGIEN